MSDPQGLEPLPRDSETELQPKMALRKKKTAAEKEGNSRDNHLPDRQF